jgi:TonB family protein
MRRCLNLLLLCLLAGAASAQDAENALKQFEGKTLILRHPLQSDVQRYDAEGKVLKGGDEGSWSIYGGVLIDRIALTPGKLRVDGRRVLFLFLDQQFRAIEFERRTDWPGKPPLSLGVEVEMVLDRPVNSIDDARALLSRVFALNNADFLDSVSELWRNFLSQRLIYDSSQEKEKEFLWREAPPSASAPAQPAKQPQISDYEGSASFQPVFVVGQDVKAPKAQYSPEPQYTDIARYEKFRGTTVVNLVVDNTGKVRRVHVVRPLGLGLDESAESTMKTWRFKPATRNGEPVAVAMKVEVSFYLY